MRKLRSDALWHKLTADQQNKIQHWLFDECLSYRQTHAQMRQELGIVCALSAIGPIYHRCEELRSQRPTASLLELAGMVNASGADAAQIHDASKTLIAAKMLNICVRKHAGINEIATLGRLMLKAEGNEILRERSDLALRRFLAATTLPPETVAGIPP